MDSGVIDLAINIAAGLLTAITLWLVQWSLRRRRINRTREFFGLAPDTECLLVVNRHASSTSDHSVHRQDVFALLELAGLIKQCGARAEVVGHDEVRRGFGERAEFSIGGPGSNTRTAAHLEWKLPGVAFPRQSDARSLTINVGDDVYRREAGVAEYVLFAKITGTEQSRPVFLICGQTAVTNQAAVRYLVANERKLARKYGTKKSFCVMLKVINPEAYGPDVVEWVGDVTDKAFNPLRSADAKPLAETGRSAVKSSATPAGEAAKPADKQAGRDQAHRHQGRRVEGCQGTGQVRGQGGHQRRDEAGREPGDQASRNQASRNQAGRDRAGHEPGSQAGRDRAGPARGQPGHRNDRQPGHRNDSAGPIGDQPADRTQARRAAGFGHRLARLRSGPADPR